MILWHATSLRSCVTDPYMGGIRSLMGPRRAASLWNRTADPHMGACETCIHCGFCGMAGLFMFIYRSSLAMQRIIFPFFLHILLRYQNYIYRSPEQYGGCLKYQRK